MTGYGQPKIKVPAFIITTIVVVIIPNETDRDTLQARIQFRFKKAIKGFSIVSVYTWISEAEKKEKESFYDDDQNERYTVSARNLLLITGDWDTRPGAFNG